MKKTFTINLGGSVYHIDDDAYALLENYLNNLRIHFSQEEGGEEIVHDMELRISELFAERLGEKKEVIVIQDVEEIIARMGKPEEFSEDAAQDAGESAGEPDKGVKRLFRNPDDKVLGGVCSGIAAYMDWDVTLVRLVLLAIAFFSQGGLVIAYIVSWIIIPEAHTATEKLSMKGMKANIENIGKAVTDGFEKVNDYVASGKPRSFLQKVGQVIVDVAGFLIKTMLVLAFICCAPLLFVLLIVCFSVFMAAIGVIGALPAIFYELMPRVDWSIIQTSPITTSLMAVSGVLLVGLPIVGFIHLLMSTFGSWKPMSNSLRVMLTLLWLLALGAGVFFVLNFGFMAIH